MKRLATLGLLLSACSTPPSPAVETDVQWASFRGNFAKGVADRYRVPATFNVPRHENLRWMRPIPGLAHSSPIIWGDAIFLTTAVKEGKAELRVGLYGDVKPVADEGPHKFQLLRLNRGDGSLRWTRTCFEGVPKIKRHPKGSHAASTPATDGRYIAAFFGSEGLYVYDFDGNLVWKKSFGVLDSGWSRARDNQWGFASSPVIHDGRIYIVCDVQDQSFVTALDVATGTEIWRTDRNEICGWGSPTVDVEDGRRQLVVNGYNHMGGYDLDTGAPRWRCSGGGDIPVPTPVVQDGIVYLTNAHGPKRPVLAISAGAEGEIPIAAAKSPLLLWSARRLGNYMQTPIVYRGNYYGCYDNGVLTCLDARTGARHYRQRLGGGISGFTASGVAADGKLYFPSEEGNVHVIAAGNTFEEIAVNELGEECMATPAIAEGVLYFRTRHHLIAIGAR